MDEEEVAAVVCARLVFAGDDACRVFRHDAETRPLVVDLRTLFFGAGDFRLQAVPVPLLGEETTTKLIKLSSCLAVVRIDRLMPLL